MAPCRGCDPDLKRTIVQLRFIGKPEGKLVKGAPGNHKQGDIVNGPDTWAEDFPKVWELVNAPPVLYIPPLDDGDDVWSYSDDAELEETVSVPEDPVVVGLTNTVSTEEENLKRIAKQYGATGNQAFLDPERGVIEDPDNIPELPRNAVKRRLEDAGVSFNPNAQTKTLRKLLAEHGLEG